MSGTGEGATPGDAAVTPPTSAGPQEPARGADASTDTTHARIPDFFILGHQKCGTTALYLMLQNHPQIFMPADKEPRFLVPELRPRPKPGGKPTRPTTLEQYLALFAGAGPEQKAGEASPHYLLYDEVPAAIAELQPAARMIAILREPAEFLRSMHLQMLHNRIETETDFQKAIELEDSRRRGEPLLRGRRWLLYSDLIQYTTQLQSFHAVFPREQLLVLIYEDYRRDNDATVREVLRFLDVDDVLPVSQVDTKPLKDIRARRLHELTVSLQEAARNPQAASPGVRALNTLLPARAREAMGAHWRRLIYRPRAEPSQEFMRDLRRRFKPEVEALGEYLGRDLVSLWGYDDLG